MARVSNTNAAQKTPRMDKPHDQYKAIASGQLMFGDAHKAVRSWFGLHIWIKACAICDIDDIEERRRIISLCPKTYVNELKLEIERVWPITR